MPGQEKMVMDFYQKNPSALASLRGTVYEEKILNLIKEKGKANKKEISKEQAEKFYEVHKERPFYQDLVNFMLTGPVLVQVLEGENAIMKNRDIMGATNPAEAAAGTIRKDFAASIDENAVHGSDAPDTAKVEINFFFKPEEICKRTRG